MPPGMAELLEDPNCWVPYKKEELPFKFEETDFIREGKNVTRVRVLKNDKKA